MSTQYRAQLRDAVEAVAIQTPISYTWFGQPMGTLPAAAAAAMTPDTQRAYLLYTLQLQLYRDFYCAGCATRTQAEPTPLATGTPSPFVHTLSTANTGRGSREPGWMLNARDNGDLVVERDGLRLWVRPEETLGINPATVAVGATLTLRFPKELMKLSPGFYMALGDAGLSANGIDLVRFYWNLRSQGAARLVGETTRRLNGAGIPFRFKVAISPDLYTRCDAGVLYVPKSQFRPVARIVRKVYAQVAADLKPRTPALTRHLAPGLGLAEEPGTGDSFGTHRCHLLADGLIRGFERGAESTDERLDVVAERFSEDGISLDAPYLNPTSADIYAHGWVEP